MKRHFHIVDNNGGCNG